MPDFCERNVNLAITALFLVAVVELVISSISGQPAIHTGTCIGAIAGVIIPAKD